MKISERFRPKGKNKKEETKRISLEEHNKIKQELEAQIKSLTETDKKITDELNSLKATYRHDIIEVLAEGCFMDDEHRKTSIDSFTRSNMSYQEIKKFLDQIRAKKEEEAKPQRSVNYIK